MSQTSEISYKELQKQAKQYGIPANMKRSFLELAIEAFVDDNHEKLNSIVSHHQSQRKRRATNCTSNSKLPLKNFHFSTTCRAGGKMAASPIQASSSSAQGHDYKLSDDDDSSNFHPDSTSTPNRSSPIVNLNHYSVAGSASADCCFQYSANDFCPPCNLSSNYLKSFAVPPTSVSLPRIRVQEMDFSYEGDRNRDLLSIDNKTDRNVTFSLTNTKRPRANSHQNDLYDHNTNNVNLNFAWQNYRTFQTTGEINATDADTVPVSATYQCSHLVDVDSASSCMPRVIEKQRWSYCLPNVAYSSDIDTLRKNTIAPEAASGSPSLNAAGTSTSFLVDNFRIFPAAASVIASNTSENRGQQLSSNFNPSIGDVASVNAEFCSDSDSDTKSLTLTDELINFFDPSLRVENRNSCDASNAVPFFSKSPTNSSASWPVLQNPSSLSSAFKNNNPSPMNWNDNNYEKNCRYRNTNDYDDGKGATVSFTSQPLLSSNIAMDGYTSLPSIAALLPECRIQAYCQEYLDSKSHLPFYESKRPCHDAYWQTSKVDDLGGGINVNESVPAKNSFDTRTHMPSITANTFRQFCTTSTAVETETEKTKIFTVPYLIGSLSPRSSQSHDVVSPYSNFYANGWETAQETEPYLPAESSSVCSSVMEVLPMAQLSFTSPFDVINEAVEEVQKRRTTTPAAEMAVSFSNRSVSKTTTSKSATCETMMDQQTASLILKHKTISIQGLKTDSETTQDIRCKSLEIKMNKAVAKGAATATICQNTTTRISPSSSPPSIFSSFRTNTAIQLQFTDGNMTPSSYRSCENKVYDCHVITPNNEESARVYKTGCLHQVVHCPSNECNWCDVVRTLNDHIYVCHKSNLNRGNDMVYVINRDRIRDRTDAAPFVTYFQLHEETIFVIKLYVHETTCIAAMQYLPRMETEFADYRNKCVKGTMQLVYFTDCKVETKCWKGIVRPYFENDETFHQTDNVLRSGIGNSKNFVVRILID